MQSTEAKIKAMQEQAVEAAVSRYGMERILKVCMKTQNFVDEVFEAFKEGRWLGYWERAYLAGAKNIYDVLYFKAAEYAKEDEKLKEALSKLEKDAHLLMFFTTYQAIRDLCIKFASFIITELGLPLELSYCKYDENADISYNGLTPEYFDMFNIIMGLPKTVKEGDQFGDCIVVNVSRKSNNEIKTVDFYNPKIDYYFTMKTYTKKSGKRSEKMLDDEKVALEFCKPPLDVYRSLCEQRKYNACVGL